MANAVGYYLSGSNHDSDSGFAYNLGNHFVLFPTHYIYHQKYQTSPSTAHFRGQYGVMRQLGTGRLFLLSSAQAALTEPDFYECVKCLVDTLNLIYDHNNNGATSPREREATTREKRIWSIKHGQESFPTGGGHRQWGRCRAEDISHSWEQQAPQKVFGLSLYVQCRRTKGNKGADTKEARRAREVWLTASWAPGVGQAEEVNWVQL